MLTGNEQNMSGGLRVYIPKCQRLFTLRHHVGGNRTIDDPAEETIVCH